MAIVLIYLLPPSVCLLLAPSRGLYAKEKDTDSIHTICHTIAKSRQGVRHNISRLPNKIGFQY